VSARHRFDDVIIATLEGSPDIRRLLQEIGAAPSRREAAAILAEFDLGRIPRRSLGAFHRHCSELLNELP
jgi:hypothetical protein